MAEISTVARPYAEALFAAVKADAAATKACVEELRVLTELMSMEDVRIALSDPRLEDDQRIEILNALLQNQQLSSQMHNFVRLLVENDRLLLLPVITEQFESLKDAAEGVAQAQITSAFPLDDNQVADLVQMLEPKFNIKLKPHVTVDPSLIGGIRVIVGDHVLDTSVQAQLNRMRDALVA
ncbi:F0F1 ATP synthase subunit delta [Orrella marina]|uniref:ATP synthase subunit delta n=1 Tax=Orrella marina TaxID=2163011 RepID=A0A2R4XMM7_9BURK|nr:F0F1 ATP synthase subunit delta [Orrella marina]AWB35053.1 F0F1 ATP synthase subunit delta [Orrella marina]